MERSQGEIIFKVGHIYIVDNIDALGTNVFIVDSYVDTDSVFGFKAGGSRRNIINYGRQILGGQSLGV